MKHSARCCKPGIPFGTVSVLGSGDEVHIKLHGAPCCATEFDSFLTILHQVRDHIGLRPFYLLYDLDKCILNTSLNTSYIQAQEDVLKGARCCAVLTSNIAKRCAVLITLKTKKKTDTITRIFPTRRAGIEWIQSERHR
jgi:hypothetical protein